MRCREDRLGCHIWTIFLATHTGCDCDLGINRDLFVNDYPCIGSQRVSEFVQALGDFDSPADLWKICQTDAEQLFEVNM